MSKIWQPTRFLVGDTEAYEVIVLNVAIENKRRFTKICSRATKIVAADGGANRIFDLGLTGEEARATTPNVIVGDLDSLRNDVKQHYEAAGVPVIHDPDQYSTDFTKSLKHIRRTQSSDASHSIVVFGGLGGRPDQAFAQLHQLHMAAQNTELASGDLYLFTDQGILFLLEKGVNIVDTSSWPELITENIGIIPLGHPAIISTQGLEWDVQDWHTSFDTQVSTSNHIKAKEIVVTTSERVFFTLEFAGEDH